MIKYYEQEQIFKLDTKESSYVFCVTDCNFIEHLYYGKYITDVDVKYISNRQRYSFSVILGNEKKEYSPATVGQEISVSSSADLRIPSLDVDFNGEIVSNRFKYLSHKIYEGRKEIKDLPSSRDKNCLSLEIVLSNENNSVTVCLVYVVYPEQNVITRYQKITNEGQNPIFLDKISSVCLDFYGHDFDMITLEGMYLCECSKVQRTALRKGIQSTGSTTGTTSHHANPFFALAAKNADENLGEVYGFNLVYSGSFKNEIEVDRLGNTRIVSGINESGFRWKLNAKDEFITPEFIMTYSDCGLGGASRNMHDHIRENIVQNAYCKRPIVINTWEAFHYDVDEKSVLSLAQSAKSCGIDTVVLDDGWFRPCDKQGLGDFFTDKNKFPHGLKYLSEKIHEMGLNFGIWIEPEMVSQNSNLYKTEENIALSTEKSPYESRSQLVVDLTVDKNVEIVANRIAEELDGVKLEYVKWDFNRYVDEVSSFNVPRGEVAHRQVLGAYKLLSAIKSKLPNVILETCSGGGGRFDLGMLYYSPQIWASDNTDPFARIYTEYGLSVAYPPSTISCHFSKGICTSGRDSSYKFRYLVASYGVYGYELDLREYSEEDFCAFKKYCEKYRSVENLILDGDLYRVISPETDEFCAYLNVSKDKTSALFTFLSINTTGHTESTIVRLKGLDEKKRYKNTITGAIFSGAALMNVGVRMDDLFEERGGSGRRVLFLEV